MVDIKVKLTYDDDHLEEFLICEDMTCTWTEGKPPGSMKLSNREILIRLVSELQSILTDGAIKKLVLQEVEA